MLFDHCETRDQVLSAFFDLTCLCHPDQGGSAEDMAALVRQARARFAAVCADDDWPFSKDRPSVMDAYCVSKGIPNPFEAPLGGAGQPPAAADAPAPFDSGALGPAPVPRMGRIWLALYRV